MRDIAESIGAHDQANLATLGHMLHYLRAFPENVHHPKEGRHLHSRLRECHPAGDAALTEIEVQHVAESRLLDQVDTALVALRSAGSEAETRPLREAVNALAEAVLQHTRFEEVEVLPLARQRLAEEDWQVIADALVANDDPRFGDLPAEEFRRLFTRMANLAMQHSSAP